MNISDRAVEAATKAHVEHGGETRWDDWEQEARDEALADMRAALKAAATHLMAAAWTEGEAAGYSNCVAVEYGGDQSTNPYRSPGAGE